jgi:hypothetical protein
MLSLGLPGMSKRCDIECARSKPIYHPDEAAVVVAERDRPSRLTFTVPRVEPGRYLVVVYDGSEGGFHYTWETFLVVAHEPSGPRGSAPWAPVMVAAALLLAVVAAATFLLQVRRARRPPAGATRGD